MKTSFQSWLCPWRVFCETVGLWELKSVWILWETSTNQPLINFSKPSVQNSEEEKGTWNSTSVLLSFLCLTRQLTIPTLWAVLEGKIGQCMVGFDPWVGKIPWRKEWQPTPVFLPGEFHGQRRLAGYSLWGVRVRHDWATNTHTQRNCSIT